MKQSQRGKMTTDQLLSGIREAGSFDEAENLRRDMQGPQFHEALFDIMSQRGLSAKDMIRLTGIERAYFYHLLNGSKKPGRNVVLRLCLSLGLPPQEINRLLRLAGVSELYARRRRDAALLFAATHHYTLEQANSLLAKAGEDPLYS